ncbi:hypothetical protein BEWA_027960 [Theileria equi strain WA]|uniref:Uncharacterized protein n=1 Tax=Theileria equi strain WA TaxID=1537102 RepID=L0AWI3_THEEQ|nr:hypothetical protein BEWA_027960 [Theileria equi strain WA]AFZ79947.1 hypothetical protein BEWA_027960 [Theileria equi strain WA]|eukprot:XP_004829613.1 hypothetical protein BEWA_027960 [Theileria equi strain WA]
METMDVDFSSRTENDDTTQTMATLLLKGWTMLSETCRQCRDVPLMRSKTGQTRCCRCQNEASDEITQNIADLCNVSTECPKGRYTHSYNSYAEIPLDSSELMKIHNRNEIPEIKSVKPISMASNHSSDFRTRQLNLLDVQLNKALKRYTAMLSVANNNDSGDIESEVSLLKGIESVLNVMDTLKRLV